MNWNDIEVRQDDETSDAVAKAMLSGVTLMVLIVLATVLVFSTGGSIVA